MMLITTTCMEEVWPEDWSTLLSNVSIKSKTEKDTQFLTFRVLYFISFQIGSHFHFLYSIPIFRLEDTSICHLSGFDLSRLMLPCTQISARFLTISISRILVGSGISTNSHGYFITFTTSGSNANIHKHLDYSSTNIFMNIWITFTTSGTSANIQRYSDYIYNRWHQCKYIQEYLDYPYNKWQRGKYSKTFGLH